MESNTEEVVAVGPGSSTTIIKADSFLAGRSKLLRNSIELPDHRRDLIERGNIAAGAKEDALVVNKFLSNSITEVVNLSYNNCTAQFSSNISALTIATIWSTRITQSQE